MADGAMTGLLSPWREGRAGLWRGLPSRKDRRWMGNDRGTSASWRCADIGESGVTPLLLASSSVRHHAVVSDGLEAAEDKRQRSGMARDVPQGPESACWLATCWQIGIAALLLLLLRSPMACTCRQANVPSLHDKMSTHHIIPFGLWRAD